MTRERPRPSEQGPELTGGLLLTKLLLFGSMALLLTGEPLWILGLFGVLIAMGIFSRLERGSAKHFTWFSGVLAAFWCFAKGVLFPPEINYALGFAGPVAIAALCAFLSSTRGHARS